MVFLLQAANVIALCHCDCTLIVIALCHSEHIYDQVA